MVKKIPTHKIELMVKENKYDKITEILEDQASKYLEMIKQ